MDVAADNLHKQIYEELKEKQYDIYSKYQEDIQLTSAKVNLKKEASQKFTSSYWKSWKGKYLNLEKRSGNSTISNNYGSQPSRSLKLDTISSNQGTLKLNTRGALKSGMKIRPKVTVWNGLASSISDNDNYKSLTEHLFQQSQSLNDDDLDENDNTNDIVKANKVKIKSKNEGRLNISLNSTPQYSMGFAIARPSSTLPVTATCSLFDTEELTRNKKRVPTAIFPSAPRFESKGMISNSSSSSSLSTSLPVFESSLLPSDLNRPGSHFGIEARFKDNNMEASRSLTTPGPQNYQIPRIFDDENEKLKREQLRALAETLRPPTGLRAMSGPALAVMGCYAYGCKFEEHVRYGICLDGKCASRASWEEAAIRQNDVCRLVGSQEVVDVVEPIINVPRLSTASAAVTSLANTLSHNNRLSTVSTEPRHHPTSRTPSRKSSDNHRSASQVEAVTEMDSNSSNATGSAVSEHSGNRTRRKNSSSRPRRRAVSPTHKPSPLSIPTTISKRRVRSLELHTISSRPSSPSLPYLDAGSLDHDRSHVDAQEGMRGVAQDSSEEDVSSTVLEYTPLELAAYLGDIQTTRRLVAQGADINEVHLTSGATCLHIAVSRQLVDFIQEMISNAKKLKLQLNTLSRDGDTPLHTASRRGYQKIVELLCDGGADPRVPNSSGTLAATEAKTHPIFQILNITARKRELEEELAEIYRAKNRIDTPYSRDGRRTV